MAEKKAPVKMQYKNLGKTGLKVSELCLGAMTFGDSHWGMPTTDEATSFKILDTFVEAGGNFIDTANIYGQGNSETIVGKWLSNKPAGFREGIVIATKVRGNMGSGPNESGLSKKHILKAAEDSLARLQTSYIDLYQVHWWDTNTPIEETLSALNDLVVAGKVRYLGVSNFTGWMMQKALAICEKNGWAPIVSLQPEYNLLCRTTEWDMIPVCKNEGLGLLPWSPLAGGWLSGKYKRGMTQPPADSRVNWAEKAKWAETNWSRLANEHTWSIIDELFKIAEENKATPAQVALRWIMQHPTVTAPILGAKSVEQLKDNLGVLNFKLTEEQMARLNKASQVPSVYPYRFYEGQL